MSQTDSERLVCLFSAVWNLQKKRGRMNVEVYLERERCGREEENENKCEG